MHRGYVKLWRKIIESNVFKNEGLLKVWIWCLAKANHKEKWVPVKIGRGKTEVLVKPGQFIFGRHKAADALDMNPNTVWKRINKLKKAQNLTIQSNNQYSIISIINWEAYQGEEIISNSESNNQVTTKEQPSNTNKNVKNVKKDKYPSDFLDIWKKFPPISRTRSSQKQSFASYKRALKSDAIENILSGLSGWLTYWRNGNEQYAPGVHRWFNDKKWENPPENPSCRTTSPHIWTGNE